MLGAIVLNHLFHRLDLWIKVMFDFYLAVTPFFGQRTPYNRIIHTIRLVYMLHPKAPMNQK